MEISQLITDNKANASSSTQPSPPPSTSSDSSNGQRDQVEQNSEPPPETPAKRKSNWSLEEDALLIELRNKDMIWKDISQKIPGRSAMSCRLHYQNYLEKRAEWDEARKDNLARLYERFKSEMWSKIAQKMSIPWRAAESMHWQLGEQEMATRAGVTPFSVSSTAVIKPQKRRKEVEGYLNEA